MSSRPREMTSYSFNNVAAYINNLMVTGLWEGDDVIIVEPVADLSTPSTGADGNSIVSISMSRAVNITLKLQPTSQTHLFLLKSYDKLQNGSTKLFSFAVTDTGTGEGGSAAQCTILRRPNTQYGAQATVREWKLFAAAWVDNKISYTG